MMPVQDYLDMYSGKKSERKAQEVDAATYRRRKEVDAITNRDAAYQAVVGRDKGSGYNSASEVEQDSRNLSPYDLELKYGGNDAAAINNSRVRAQNEYRWDKNSSRSWAEAYTDSTADAEAAAVSGLGGLAAWGASYFNDEMAAAISKATNTYSTARKANQSDGLNAQKRIAGADANNAIRDNYAVYDNSDKSIIDLALREGSNVVDVTSQIVKNPTVAESIIAEMGGSIVASAGIAGGLRAIGAKVLSGAGSTIIRGGGAGSTVAGRAFSAAEKTGRSLTMPVAIGLQEGGGAYSGTLDEAMSLLVDRNDLTQDQKLRLATGAAQTAAAIQAPISAVLGKITGAARLEAMILRGRPSSQFISAVAREMTEEGLQSASGQTATNFALSQEIDPGRDLGEGVGENVAYGIVGGAGGAGVTSGPSSLAKGTRNVAVAGAKAIVDPIIARGQKIEEAARAASPFSAENVSETFSSVAQAVPDILNRVKDTDYSAAAQNIADAVTNTNIDDVRGWAETATDTAKSSYDRLASAYNLRFGKDASEQVIEGSFKDVTPKNQGPVPEEVNQLTDTLRLAYQQDGVQEAMDAAEELASEIVIDIEDVTPDNDSAISSAVAVAEIAPDNSDPDVNNTVLKHADEGKIQISPMQRASLLAANALKEAQAVKISTENTNNKQGVSRILEDEASENTAAVNRFMRQGDTEGASVQLDDMRQLAELLQNKVRALNEHLKKGTGNKSDAVGYRNLIGELGSRKWIPAETGMWANLNAPKTMQFARAVESDAQAMTQLVNNLSTIYPELNINPLPDIALEDASTVAKAQPKATEKQPTDGSSAANVQQNEDPIPPEAAPSFVPKDERKTAEGQDKSTTVAEETVQPKGGDTSTEADTKPAKGQTKVTAKRAEKLSDDALNRAIERAQKLLAVEGKNKNPDIVATLEVLSNELTAREGRVSEQNKVEETKVETNDESKQAPAETNKSEQQTADDVVVEPRTPDTDAGDRGTDTGDGGLFPNLIGSKDSKLVGWFKKAFKFPETARTRTFGTGSPMTTIVAALKSSSSLEAFIGKKLRHEYSQELADTYARYVEVEGKALGETMRANLASFMNRIYGGVETNLVDGVSPKKKDGNPVDLLTMKNGKAFNITEVVDGKVRYNPELLGGAVLAGLQWMLTTERVQRRADEEDVSKIFKLDSDSPSLDRITEEFNRGMGVTEIKRTLARQVIRYWGVTTNNETDLAMVQGVAEAVAAEVLTALVDNKILKVHTIRVTEFDGLPVTSTDLNKVKRWEARKNKKWPENWPRSIQEMDRYFPVEGIAKEMAKWPTAIEEAVMVDPEVNHIGQAPKTVANTQINNRRAYNTKSGKAALAKENSTEYRLDFPMVDGFTALGEEGVTYMFAGGNLKNRPLNKQTFESLDGKNKAFISAYQSLERLVAEVKELSKVAKLSPDEMAVYFEHNFSSIGRMQQLGLNSPQSSKLMREALLPTWSRLDLTDRNSAHSKWFGLALAQALGEKVETQPIDTSVEKTISRLENQEELGAAVDILRTFLSSGRKKLSEKDITAIRAALDDENTPVAFHALMDYARYKEAESSGKLGRFRTSMYVEADGVTNGPVNAIAMLTPGTFSSLWIRNMAKGGMFLSDMGMTMNTHRSSESGDKNDLYTSMAEKLKGFISDTFKSLHENDNRDGKIQLHSLLSVMSALKPKDFVDKSQGEWVISRKITKNPLTITLYGSGEEGIARNIAKDIADSLYQKLSDASELMAEDPNITLAEAMFRDQATSDVTPNDLLKQFERRFNTLLTKKAVKTKKGLWIKPSDVSGISFANMDRKTFTLNKAQRNVLRENIQTMFVKEMTQAIEDTVGEPVITALANLRKATQVQGIFYEAAFQREFERATAKLKDDQFLSQKEIDQILDRLSYLAPKIETGDQLFDIAGSNKTDVGNKEFGRAFNDGFVSPAEVAGPVNPGVSGVPTMVIGSGDGFMMQMLSNMLNAIKGTLKVFDGMNMPLDKIEEGSNQANEAAFKSWMNNPLRQVHQTFARFLKDAPTENFDDKQRADLEEALFTYKQRRQGVSDKDIIDAMKQLEIDLGNQALSAEARHNVLGRTRMAVDQMASTGVTYQNDGEGYIDLTGMTDNQAARVLTDEFWKELTKLRGDEAVSENVGTDLENVGVVDEESGARVISAVDLKHLVSNAKIPSEQKNLLAAVLQSRKADAYTVVIGVPWRLAQWVNANGKNAQKIDEHDHGLTVVGENVIYITSRDPSAETVVHELLHASTFETVLAHYQGNTSGANQVETGRAIERIEALMDQFLGMEDQVTELSPEAISSYRNALLTINNWLDRSDISEASRKAGALNEFMAWSLTNQDLIRLGQRTKATPFARMVRSVIDGLKSLIFGKRNPSPKIGDDIFSNLRFNTEILLNAEPTVAMLLNEVLYHSGPQDRNGHLKYIQDIFDDKVAQYLNVDLKDMINRDTVSNQATLLSKETARIFSMHFPMSVQERDTFTSVVMALATEAELDHNALREAQNLYAHTIKVMKPSDFMSDPASTDQNDLALAQDRYDAVIGLYMNQKDASNRSTLLPAFIGLSMTNEVFRTALSRMAVPSKKLGEWNTLDGILTNVGIMSMDRLGEAMAGSDRKARDVREAMASLSNRLIEQAQEREVGILTMLGNTMAATTNYLNDKVVGAMGVVSNVGVNASRAGLNKTNNKVARMGLRMTEFFASSINEVNAEEARRGFMSQMNKLSNAPKWTSELMNELVGRTSENAPVYDMIKLVRSWVQQSRQVFRENLPKVLAGKFSKELSDEQWKALNTGIGKSDIASLISYGRMTEAQVIELLSDPAKLRREISKLEAEAKALNSTKWPKWEKLSKNLAAMMIKGERSNNSLRNAFAVANLFGETAPGKPAYSPDSIEVTTLDMLISLYAIEEMPASVRASVRELADTEADGISFSLSSLVGQRRLENEKGSVSELALVNHYKGNLPSETKGGGTLIVATSKSEGEQRALGFMKQKDYVGSRADGTGPKMSYYFSKISGKGPYSQGIIQNIRPSYYGVDPLTGLSNGGITADPMTYINDVRVAERRMRRGQNQGSNELLMPVYDIEGNVIAFERSLDNDMLALLEKKEHLAENIGMWRGRQAEEHQASTFNNRLLNELKARWDADKATRNDEYVNVLDKRELKKDPVLRDSVRLLNKETLSTARALFGKDKLWVRRDMLNDVLGYRAFTIADLWTGNTRMPKKTRDAARQLLVGVFREDAYTKLVKGEQFIKNFVTDARVTIVVKSVIVPAANLMANFFQLLSRGVAIPDILKGMAGKTSEIDGFVKRRLRLVEAEAELRASSRDPAKAKILQKEIQTILDANRRMSIWPLIEAGEFASIADTGISQDEILLAEGRLTDYMERLTSKLPDSLKTAARYGIISRDTALYKGLQRAVEYGDFLGKAVLYDHLTKKKKLSKEQALARITEEFVNYDRLAGRSRTYLENMGLMWFWNFKLRSVKVATNMIRNNPVHALFAMSGPIATDMTAVGSPIYDNAAAVFLDGRSHWSLGTNMAFNAHLLNPWYNMST